jgi:orotidine-5'-phosphate decarboxylase
VVCSVWESKQIKQKVSNKMLTVTPGIRMIKTNDDQQRVASPRDAKNNLVNYIVVGRPITQAKDPYKVYKEILKEFQGV